MNPILNALNKIVLIGASTGGPGEVQKIVSSLPKLQNSAVVIAQHMAVEFLPSFVKRLQEYSINNIYISEDELPLREGNIYFCNKISEVFLKGSNLYFHVKPFEGAFSYNPSIDAVFNSFTPFCKDLEILSVILTGIGSDGVDGCKYLSLCGSRVITQTQADAIVDGMPARARESIKNIEVYKTQKIIEEIVRFCD